MRSLRGVCLALAFLLSSLPTFSKQASGVPSGQNARIGYASIPLTFEANRGQAARQVQFVCRAAGAELLLTQDALLISDSSNRQPELLAIQWANTGGHAQPRGEQEQPGRTNYLIGDENHWLTGIRNFGRVRYANIYPGIDLVYHGNHSEMEYDLEVSPGADASALDMRVTSSGGVELDSEGDLVIHTRSGTVVWHKPVAYQEINGTRRDIPVRYQLASERIRFVLGDYDHSRSLIIDPILSYAALIGPNDFEAYVAVDKHGDAYLATNTISRHFPTTAGAFMTKGQFVYRPPSAYIGGAHDLISISKFNEDGSKLLYSTYLGGSEYVCSNPGPFGPLGSFPFNIVVDEHGDAIIVGATQDTDFPVTKNALQKNVTDCFAQDFGNGEGFISELNPTGSGLIYSSYLSSSGADSYALSAAVDRHGNIYVGGTAESTDFPHTKSFDPCTGTCGDLYLLKLSPSGGLVYGVLFGGGPNLGTPPYLSAVQLDHSGNVYFAGWTESQTLPVVNAIQPTLKGSSNAFVGELRGDASGFDFLTYYGGSGFDYAYGLGLDGAGNIYFSGSTSSLDFPIKHAFQGTNPAPNCIAIGNSAAYIAELTPSGTDVQYSTYFGGTTGCEVDFAQMAVDAKGRAYVTGWTDATDLPVTADAFQSAPNPEAFTTAYLTIFQPGGQSLFYSTYLGGGGDNIGDFVALSPNQKDVLVSGQFINPLSPAVNFPVTPGAFNQAFAGHPRTNRGFAQVSAAFLAKFCLSCR